MNAKKRSKIHKVFLYTCLSSVIAFGLMSIVGTGGGSSDGYTDPCSIGVLHIKGPTSGESYSTSLTPISLRGTAPFASDWSYSDPGVRVSWDNNATGESGEAHSWVDCDPIGYPPFVFCIYYHRWSACIPLLEGENPITVTASEDGEIVGGDCITVTYVPDTTAPTIPTNLTATHVSSSGIDLSWDASTDDVGVEGYNIYRDGTYIRSVTETSASDTELSPETHYCYAVSAYDTAGNESPQSTEACAITSWVIDFIESYAGRPSIAVDSLDRVHISYYDLKNSFKYATNASGVWIIDTIAPGYVDHISIAVDSLDKLHISGLDISSGLIKYATNASGVWATNTIDNLEGYSRGVTSIAVDSLDKVHISCFDLYSGLKYATNASGAWIIDTIDTWGPYNSIAVDSLDKVHISFGSEGFGLKYGTNASGAWVAYIIDGPGGLYPSVAIDSSDKVHISYTYTDGSNKELRYATNR